MDVRPLSRCPGMRERDPERGESTRDEGRISVPSLESQFRCGLCSERGPFAVSSVWPGRIIFCLARWTRLGSASSAIDPREGIISEERNKKAVEDDLRGSLSIGGFFGPQRSLYTRQRTRLRPV